MYVPSPQLVERVHATLDGKSRGYVDDARPQGDVNFFPHCDPTLHRMVQDRIRAGHQVGVLIHLGGTAQCIFSSILVGLSARTLLDVLADLPPGSTVSLHRRDCLETSP